MFSSRFGILLRSARKQLGISRDELAERGGVSTRLVAELERGQRPNVSLESALRLLDAVGVSILAKAPDGATAEVRSPASLALERAARAEQRRQTWTGRHIYLHDEGRSPLPPRSTTMRVAAVSDLSRQAYMVAGRSKRGTRSGPSRQK